MNLAISLFKHERIQTTLAKAKALRPFAEKLITQAKNGSKSLHTIRQLSSKLSDKAIVKKLIEEIADRFKKRHGGYTRIYKCGFRANDSAPLALIELVDYADKLKEKESKGAASEKISKGAATIKEKLTSLVKPKETKEEEKKVEERKIEEKKEEMQASDEKKVEDKKSSNKVTEKKSTAKKDSKAKKSE